MNSGAHRGFAVLVAACLFSCQAFAADKAPLPRDAGNREILEELRKIRALLEKMQAPAVPAAAPAAPAAPQGPVKVSLEGAYILGKPDAPLTMVEFSDFECPFCRAFHLGAFEQIKREFIDTGKLRYISRDFPLAFHASATPAARAARCAGEQGKFWELRRALLVNNASLGGVEGIAAIGAKAGLDEKSLRACMSSDKFDAAIGKDQELAQSIGVQGTPTFVIGASQGSSVEGLLLVGAQPYSTFESRFRSLLTN